MRAVVFDLNGVIKSAPRMTAVSAYLEDGHLDRDRVLAELADINNLASKGAITEDEMNNQVGTVLGIRGSELTELVAAVWEEYLSPVNDALMKFFDRLRPAYRTALLSNSFVGARQREERRYQFSRLTDTIVYSHEVGVLKPDPAIYHLTCQRLGVSPDETVFLDDDPDYVEAARAIGMRGIVYVDNVQAISAIRACLRES
jgi:epoxide hydrolase-like predicted phosphatase